MSCNVDHDVNLLVEGIKRIGVQQEDGNFQTTFGEIFTDKDLEQQLESLKCVKLPTNKSNHLSELNFRFRKTEIVYLTTYFSTSDHQYANRYLLNSYRHYAKKVPLKEENYTSCKQYLKIDHKFLNFNDFEYAGNFDSKIFKIRSITRNPTLNYYYYYNYSSSYGRKESQKRKWEAKQSKRAINIALYVITLVILFLGIGYAAVPLYRLFCRVTGYGGTPKINTDVKEVPINKDKRIKVKFEAQVDPGLLWNFSPCQDSITVHPGEKALAFYEAENFSRDPIIGMATYNVLPDQVGQYFNKIQCFCFDEQRLNPNEKVFMPVHFYVDPEILNDNYISGITDITLSYTFFMAEDQTYDYSEHENAK